MRELIIAWVAAMFISAAIVLVAAYAWAQSTEGEQRSIPLIQSIAMVGFPIDNTTDGDLAHAAGVFAGVFAGGGGTPPTSTGSTQGAHAATALTILRRIK